MERVKVTLEVEPATLEGLERYAKRRGIERETVMRVAFQEFVERDRERAILEGRREAMR